MLNLNDLLSLQVVIELATKRGAFNANEMKDIGELYNRLVDANKFLVEEVEKHHAASSKENSQGQE